MPAEIPKNSVSTGSGRAAMLKRLSEDSDSESPTAASIDGEGRLQNIAVSKIIKSRFQPRILFNQSKVDALAESIDEVGLAKPILVRPLGDDLFELVGGERRWRAVQRLGWSHIQSVVKSMSDDTAMILALADNEHEPLTDYENAVSYHRYLQTGQDRSQRALAKRLGKDNSVVSRCLELMKLSETIRRCLDQHPGLITANYAKKFVDFSDRYVHIVERQVLSMAEKGIKQEQALRMIAQKIASLSHQPVATVVPKVVNGIGTIQLTGKKVEIRCEKGIDPNRLLAQFETFLANLDRELLATESQN